jgi:hypothetical protein
VNPAAVLSLIMDLYQQIVELQAKVSKLEAEAE